MPVSACGARAAGDLAAGDGLAFVALGDWGGMSGEEPTTESQLMTSAGLTSTACRVGANFSLLLGDNFYDHGIAEPAESSVRFRDSFEEVYARQLPGVPFYPCAGNHDYGVSEMANVSAQLAYSKLSSQWRFPSLWYKIHKRFSAAGEQRSLDVLMIDTIVLCGHGDDSAEVIIDKQLQFLGQPADAERPGRLRLAVAERQWAWLEGELRGSTADFLLVAGHFPIWSVGKEGATQCLIDRLRPMLVEHGAHYVSGHDHMLEHFVHEGLNTFVVGAGKECCFPPSNPEGAPPGALRYMLAGADGDMSQPPAGFAVHGGFAAFVLGAETMEVSLLAHDGTVLYTAPPVDRRWRLAEGVAASSRAGAGGGGLQRALPLLPALAAACAAVLGWRRWRGRGPRGPAAAPLLQVQG